MTAEAFAGLVEAHHTGVERWQARCPAHADRSPSLSIRVGLDGRVLVHCFAGCEASAVLTALGLTWRDVCGAPITPEQARRATRLRAAREAEQRTQRQARRETDENLRRWEAVVDSLGGKLARVPDGSPEGAGLALLFHQACDRLREAEISAERTR